MKTDRAPRLALRATLPPLPGRLDEKLPCFELTYLAHGRTWKALVRAAHARAAAAEGLIELASQFPEFDHEAARLVSALETR